MDIFAEQLIKKKKDLKDILIITSIITLLSLLTLICFFSVAYIPFMATISLFVFLGSIWISIILTRSRNIEFEYSIINGDVTIDKIIAKRSRKFIISFDAKNIKSMGKYDHSKHPKKSYNKVLYTCIDINNDNIWFALFKHQKHGNVLLVFSPNEKTLKAIKPFLKRQVASDAFSGN